MSVLLLVERKVPSRGGDFFCLSCDRWRVQFGRKSRLSRVLCLKTPQHRHHRGTSAGGQSAEDAEGLPQHAIRLYLLAQARNDWPQLDTSFGQEDTWPQHHLQGNPAAALSHNQDLARRLGFGDRWRQWCSYLANRSRCASLGLTLPTGAGAASVSNDTPSPNRDKCHRPTRPPTNMPTRTNPERQAGGRLPQNDAVVR